MAATLLAGLAGRPAVRRTADALFLHYARRRVRKLDAMDVPAVQDRTLLKLVRRAASTQFGRDHDFAAVRTVRDYQARVPLRTYEQFWADYWGPVHPRLQGVTWPDFAPYHALSSGTTSGATKYLPVTRELVAANRRCANTLLAFYRHAHPDARIFAGRVFFLGGSTSLTAQADGSRAGDLSGIAAAEVSPALRAYTFPPPEVGLMTDWEAKSDRLAELAARLPVTMVTGIPSWLLTVFEKLRRVTGKDKLIDVWPQLRLIVHGGVLFDPYRAVFRDLVGSDRVSFLDTYPASEGYVATEDPRHGRLRLLPDHDVFFEFVPVDEVDAPNPTRHTAANFESNLPYAVVVTTCAGLWSYVLGDAIVFESRDPPLLRFVGRTKQFLSAFGEHLVNEEVERAVALAAESTGALVRDFHVGPVFPERTGQPGRHRFLVEFIKPPADLPAFAAEIDAALDVINKDYHAYRAGGITVAAPEVVSVWQGGFADWMRDRGKYGGQHKLPRMDNTGRLTAEMTDWLGRTSDR